MWKTEMSRSGPVMVTLAARASTSALVWSAGDDLGDVVGDRRQGSGLWGVGFVVQGEGEVVAADA